LTSVYALAVGYGPQSVQGELNPRIHHGKVAGCQATSWTHLATVQVAAATSYRPKPVSPDSKSGA